MGFNFQDIKENTATDIVDNNKHDIILSSINYTLIHEGINKLNKLDDNLYGITHKQYSISTIMMDVFNIFDIIYRIEPYFLNYININIFNDIQFQVDSNTNYNIALFTYRPEGSSVYGDMKNLGIVDVSDITTYELTNYNIHAILTFLRFLNYNLQYIVETRSSNLSFQLIIDLYNQQLPGKNVILSYMEKDLWTKLNCLQFIATVDNNKQYFDKIYINGSHAYKIILSILKDAYPKLTIFENTYINHILLYTYCNNIAIELEQKYNINLKDYVIDL